MGSETVNKSFTMLLVDDEEDIRECWVELLENPAKQEVFLGSDYEDYEVEILSAEDGDEALEIVKSEKVDLILSDLMMARMGGLELLEKVKEYDSTIPVMIITGRGDEQVAVTLLEKGAFTYIIKGHFRNSSTFHKINSALHLREQYSRIKELSTQNDKLKGQLKTDGSAEGEKLAEPSQSAMSDINIVELMNKIESLNEDLSTALKIIFHNNSKMDEIAEQADIFAEINKDSSLDDSAKFAKCEKIINRVQDILYSDMMV